MSSPVNQLEFTNFDQVGDYLHLLLSQGYQQSGTWNLSQTALHLNDWITFPILGYPKTTIPLRPLIWSFKIFFGRRQLRKILKTGFSPGIPTLATTVHSAEEHTDTQAVAQYLKSIDQFRCHNRNYKASPVFGHMTPENMLQLQLLHAAHHLALLKPN